MKITAYKVLIESSPSRLANAVMEYAQLGWEPIGGVSICKENGFAAFERYAQAIVKTP